MQLKQWSDIYGKRLTLSIQVGTALGTTEATAIVRCKNITNKNSVPQIVFPKLHLLDTRVKHNYYHHIKPIGRVALPHTGAVTSKGKGVLGLNTIYSSRDAFSLSCAKAEVVEINGTRLEHLFGPNLQNWPLRALQLKFSRFMQEASKKDVHLKLKVTAAMFGKEEFLTALELCRTVKQEKTASAPKELKCLNRLFKL